MNAPRLATALLVAVSAAGAEAARADDKDCTTPMRDWQPRQAVLDMAAAEGWTLRRITTDDGCYVLFGTDAEGRDFRLRVDPGSLAMVGLDLPEWRDDDEDDDRGYDEDDDDDHGARPAPAGTAAPPDNGLFSPGATAPVQND